MKHTLYIIMAAALVCACGGTKIDNKVEALKVTTEEAGNISADNTTGYVGTVEAQSQTAVSFTGSGMLTRVCVSEGQTVAKGQLIAEIDDTQMQNMLCTAEAQMNQANDALARMKQIHDAGSLPEIKWVEIQSQVAQASQQVAMAKKAIADCKVYAPVSGVVGSKMLNTGETALPSEPVCMILDISNVKVVVSIPEKEIASVSANTSSDIYVAAVGRNFKGGRIEKGVQADALTHTYDIKIAVSNADHQLLPGMVANVRLAGNKAQEGNAEAITVPVRAVQRDAKGQHFVWVAKDGKAHRQDVIVGETVGNRIVIASGVEKGQKVIVEGYQKVSDGSAIVL